MSTTFRILYYSNHHAPTDRLDLGYTMIFPGMTIVKILLAGTVPALFGPRPGREGTRRSTVRCIDRDRITQRLTQLRACLDYAVRS